MKDIKIATLKLNIKKSKDYREALCAWLHEKAEEIKKLDPDKYADNPSWNFII